MPKELGNDGLSSGTALVFLARSSPRADFAGMEPSARRQQRRPNVFRGVGFVEVLSDRMTILAQNAVKPEEIDAGEVSSKWKAVTNSGMRPVSMRTSMSRPTKSSTEAQVKLASAHNSSAQV
jgi:F0F1-type ATP synthase epsilon subunit